MGCIPRIESEAMTVRLLRRGMRTRRCRGLPASAIVTAAIIVRAGQHEVVRAGNTASPQHGRRDQESQKRTERRPHHVSSEPTAPSRGCQTRVTLKTSMPREPRIEIEYCTQCRWLLRAAWMAQELLTTFSEEIGEIALIPGTGGVFEIRIGAESVWSREKHDGFPEIKALKQLVRDRIAPEKNLGHSDR